MVTNVTKAGGFPLGFYGRKQDALISRFLKVESFYEVFSHRVCVCFRDVLVGALLRPPHGSGG